MLVEMQRLGLFGLHGTSGNMKKLMGVTTTNSAIIMNVENMSNIECNLDVIRDGILPSYIILQYYLTHF